MARPIKKGLDYYPQDTDLFANRKIRRLLHAHGAQGYMVYEYIKGLCYGENGYWVRCDQFFCCDVADALCGTDENCVMDIIVTCMNLDLFDEHLFNSRGIITAAGIQARYLLAKRNPVIDAKIRVIEDKTPVMAVETPVITAITPINAAESTQRRGKEIKGNKTKEKEIKKEEKERKENETLREDFSPPPQFLKFSEKKGRDIGYKVFFNPSPLPGKTKSRTLTHCPGRYDRATLDCDFRYSNTVYSASHGPPNHSVIFFV